MTDGDFSLAEIVGRAGEARKKRKESSAGGLSLKEGAKGKEEVKGSLSRGSVLKEEVPIEPPLKKLKGSSKSGTKAMTLATGCASRTRSSTGGGLCKQIAATLPTLTVDLTESRTSSSLCSRPMVGLTIAEKHNLSQQLHRDLAKAKGSVISLNAKEEALVDQIATDVEGEPWIRACVDSVSKTLVLLQGIRKRYREGTDVPAAAFTEEIESLKKEAEGLKEHIRSLEKEKNATEGRVKTLELELKVAQSDSSNAEAKLALANQRKDKLVEEKDALEKELDTLKASQDEAQFDTMLVSFQNGIRQAKYLNTHLRHQLKFAGADVTLEVFPDGLRKREKKDGPMLLDYDWDATMEEEGTSVIRDNVPLPPVDNSEVGNAELRADDGGRIVRDVDPHV